MVASCGWLSRPPHSPFSMLTIETLARFLFSAAVQCCVGLLTDAPKFPLLRRAHAALPRQEGTLHVQTTLKRGRGG